MHVVDGCEEFGHVLSMTCGVDSCVGGGVNCGSGSVLCAVLVVFLLQCWFSASSCRSYWWWQNGGRGCMQLLSLMLLRVTVTGGDFEAPRAFEDVAFPLLPHLDLAEGPFCLIPLMG